MNIVCLDLEGVLVPEIWIAFAKASHIPDLNEVETGHLKGTWSWLKGDSADYSTDRSNAWC